MHVSRSQSAFLWLLHYETIPPPPHPHNGGGGGSAIPWGIVDLNLPYPESSGFLVKGIVEVLLVESGILGFRIRILAQGIRNPPYDWNPESRFY